MMQRRKPLPTCLALTLGLSAAAAAAEPPPRAWLALRDDAAVVIVGESHLNTPPEFDAVYERIVRPSFEAAQLLLLENHAGAENLAATAYLRVMPCEQEPGGRRNERARPRFAALEAATRAARLEVPNWMSAWEIMPEIALASFHLIDFAARDVDALRRAAQRSTPDERAVSDRLAAEAARRRRPPIAGLETVADVRGHFCAAGAEQRQDYLIGVVDSVLGRLRALDEVRRTGLAPDVTADAVRLWTEALRCADSGAACAYPPSTAADGSSLARYGMALSDSPGVFKLGIVDRTRSWLPRIVAAGQRHRRSLVVVGALHLPDWRHGGATHAGLLSQLRQQGFTVRPVREPGDLGPYLRRRWWERLLPD